MFYSYFLRSKLDIDEVLEYAQINFIIIINMKIQRRVVDTIVYMEKKGAV